MSWNARQNRESNWKYSGVYLQASGELHPNRISRLSISGYCQNALLPGEWKKKKHSKVKAILLKIGSSLASQTVSVLLAQLLFNTSPACHSPLSTHGVCWWPGRPGRRFLSTSAWPGANHSASISPHSLSLSWDRETNREVVASFQVNIGNCRHLDCYSTHGLVLWHDWCQMKVAWAGRSTYSWEHL